MKLTRHVCLAPTDGCDEAIFESSPLDAPSRHQQVAPLRRAIMRTRQWLLAQQDADGFWCGELEGGTILESEYILLLAYLGRETSQLAKKAAQYLVEKQLPEGGWALYPGSGIDISGSVKAYFALKLTGHDPSLEYMDRARRAILTAGGADRVNSFTRFYLALLGQISYDHCPEVPPEVLLLPKWLPVHLYRVSAWTRTMLVPLSIMSVHRPVREIEPERGIRDLFLRKPEDWPPSRCPGQKGGTGPLSWDRFFRVMDRLMKFCRRHHLLPLRAKAVAAAERWLLERFEQSDGLGAIFPPIVWSAVALDCLGYDDQSPEMQYCLGHLQDLVIEEDETARVQPCKSPVWDTAITIKSLIASGQQPTDPAIVRGVEWLLSKQARRKGDWAETVKARPGGWYFEHNNEFYPDLDDTSIVLLALRSQLDGPSQHNEALPPGLHVVGPRSVDSLDEARSTVELVDETVTAAGRAIDWTLAMQNNDGGWGAFDRNNDHEFLCHVPFADHNAMIDPSTPDLTARVLEALGAWGYRVGHSAVDRAVDYLRRTQEADGSWFGRWGVNYIYGTWQALCGLRAIGLPKDDPMIVGGANWLLAHQQASGAWGESADSYADVSLRGQGPATASQTSWALLGLMAAGYEQQPAVARGVRYLLDTQNDDGTWDEEEFTGTGFPQVFYLRYHMYRVYFPLLALSLGAVAVEHGVDQEAAKTALRLVNAASLAAAQT